MNSGLNSGLNACSSLCVCVNVAVFNEINQLTVNPDSKYTSYLFELQMASAHRTSIVSIGLDQAASICVIVLTQLLVTYPLVHVLGIVRAATQLLVTYPLVHVLGIVRAAGLDKHVNIVSIATSYIVLDNGAKVLSCFIYHETAACIYLL